MTPEVRAGQGAGEVTDGWQGNRWRGLVPGRPAAHSQQQAVEERAKLLGAVTTSLQRNSDAMEKMASAVERLQTELLMKIQQKNTGGG